MATHHFLDSLGGFIGVVEWDGADVVVKNVRLDNTVEELATNEAEFTIDGCGCATDVVPGLRGVVG